MVMKIVVFVGGLSGGGAERVCCNLANALSVYKNAVTFLTVSDDEPTYPINAGIGRYVLLKQSERRNVLGDMLMRLFRLWRFLCRTNNDCYVVMMPRTTILLLLFKKWTTAKIIASERADPATYPSLLQWWLKRLAHRADGWVFQTEEQRSWYGNAIGSAASIVIPNAVNSDFLSVHYCGERRKEIVSSGRLTSQKNHALLIKAFARIAAQHPDYRLVIYGEGPLRAELERLIEALQLSGRVLLPGYTINIKECVEQASMFVLSSDFEGMPNALIEAMALGVPCIATDCQGGGAKFLIDDGVNGVLVLRGDEGALVDAMQHLLEDEVHAEKLGQQARKLCETLSPQAIYGEWAAFIQQVTDQKKL